MKIVVVGAGGCVGGWICEEIAERADVELVACVRSWASAQRVARRGVALSLADIESGPHVENLLSDADAVINAAMLPSDREADLVAGLYSACARAGVRRFIQFSSAVVYGNRTGDFNEDVPLAPDSDYSRGKVEMERKLTAAAAKSETQVCILRPSIVYGPFAEVWTVMYAQRIANARWRGLGRAGDGMSNLVHAHDLARAAIMAAMAPVSAGTHILNINGPDVVSWNEYIERFGDALGITDRTVPNYVRFRAGTIAADLVRRGGSFAKRTGIYRPGGSAQPLAENAKRFAGAYLLPPEVSLLRRKARYSCDKAAMSLRFRPSISLDEGLRQSASWCRTHGVV